MALSQVSGMQPISHQVLTESSGLQEAGTQAWDGKVKEAPCAHPGPSPCRVCAQVHLLVPQRGAASATAAAKTAGAAQGAARSWGAAMSSDQDPERPVDGNDSPGQAAVFSL